MKRARTFLIAGVAFFAIGGALSVPALAAAPHGKLSSKEYSLLSTAQSKLSAALSKKSVNWAGVLAACESVGSSTALLKTQRVSCVAETQLFDGLVEFPRREGGCGTAALHKDLCLVPLYAALAKDANALYSTNVAARRTLVQRGFKGLCLDALGSNPKQMGDQRNLATKTQALANDVKRSAEVVEGKLPSSTVNVSQIDADAKAFERDVNLVLDQNSPMLSNCPHK